VFATDWSISPASSPTDRSLREWVDQLGAPTVRERLGGICQRVEQHRLCTAGGHGTSACDSIQEIS